MKRDMELIKNLLEYIEEHYDGLELARPITINEDENLKKRVEKFNEINKGKDIGVVFHYHLNLLVEAGLVLAVPDERHKVDNSLLIPYYPIRLTWEGHEFIAATKNKTLWTQAKKVAGDFSFSAFIQVMNTLACQWALNQLSGS